MADPREHARSAPAADSLADLAARVASLEARIASLEAPRAEENAHRLPRRDSEGPPNGTTRFDFETAVGLTWLNRTGALLLIFGLGLATFWAHERGYLSPVIREVLGGVLAVALFALGVCATASTAAGRRTFGSGVTLVGAFGLYLVPVSASRVDALISPDAAFVILVAVTLFLALLAHRLDRRLFALLGLGGGLVAPLVVGGGGHDLGPLFAYLAVLAAGFVCLQHLHRWRLLDLFASLGLSAYFLSSLVEPRPDEPATALIGLALWGAHLAYAMPRLGLLAPRRDDGFHLALLVAAGLGGYAGLFAGGLPVGVGEGLAILLFAVHVILWRAPSPPRFAFALLALSALACTYLLLEGAATGASWMAPGLATLACTSFVATYLARAAAESPLVDEDHALAAVASAAFVAFWLVAAAHWGSMAVAAGPIFLLGIVWLGGSAKLRRVHGAAEAAEWSAIYATVVCTAAAVLAFEAISADLHAMSLVSTIAIVLCGLVLVRIGVRASFTASRIVGLTVLSVALIKLFALDLWLLATGPRIAVLVALGAGLLSASFLYGRFADTKSSGSDDALLSLRELERRREALLDAIGQVPNDPGLLARLDDHGSP